MQPLVGGMLAKAGASKGLQTGMNLGMRGLGAAGRANEAPGTPNTAMGLPGILNPQGQTGEPEGPGTKMLKKLRKSMFTPYEDME